MIRQHRPPQLAGYLNPLPLAAWSPDPVPPCGRVLDAPPDGDVPDPPVVSVVLDVCVMNSAARACMSPCAVSPPVPVAEVPLPAAVPSALPLAVVELDGSGLVILQCSDSESCTRILR